ncbi:uncharacterized protein TNCV_3281811 [Trichonephila clavipes]|nr:uncharacterized protein TNCV_3281811 [Trichonephila clavipes]
MSERSHLPDSLRWRVVGWLEMRLSKADAARRLNVTRSVVHRLWNQYKTEASVSRDMFQSDHKLQHMQETILLLFRPKGEEGFQRHNVLKITQ